MAQRAFRIDLGREGDLGHAGRADSRTSIDRDFFIGPARPRSSHKPGFFTRSLIAVHNAPFALALRARRVFRRESLITAILTVIVGGLAVWFWFAFFMEATR